MANAHTESASIPAPQGTLTLRLALIVISIASLVGFWTANSRTDEYRLHYPLFTPALWNLYLTFSLASFVACIAMWNWRIWGLWLFTAMAVATLFTEFYAMGFTLGSFRIPVALATVWYLVQRVWSRFH
jgi:hypothetical protein